MPHTVSSEGSNALFQHATEGILVTDHDGTIIRINPSAEKLFGYEHDELVGQKIETLIPQQFRTSHAEQRAHYAEKPYRRAFGQERNLKALKKDGSTFPVEVSLSPYMVGGRNFFIAFIIDISQRVKAEEQLRLYSSDLEQQVRNRTLVLEEAIEELEKTQRDLHRALEKERELNEMKSRFVSLASHEFRTPLSTMMSSLALIERYGEKNDLENQRKHIRKIKSSINNLTDILNDFLSVSKLEEGKVDYHPEKSNLYELLQEVTDEMMPMLRNEQRLELNYSGRNSGITDPKLIRNILFNIVSNAIKFSPLNGLVRVDVVRDNNFLNISVTDSGAGIPEKELQHLFTRFFRASNVAHIQGTGLGLSIVQKYLELLGGTIAIESEENRGTTVRLTIPLSDEEDSTH